MRKTWQTSNHQLTQSEQELPNRRSMEKVGGKGIAPPSSKHDLANLRAGQLLSEPKKSGGIKCNRNIASQLQEDLLPDLQKFKQEMDDMKAAITEKMKAKQPYSKKDIDAILNVKLKQNPRQSGGVAEDLLDSWTTSETTNYPSVEHGESGGKEDAQDLLFPSMENTEAMKLILNEKVDVKKPSLKKDIAGTVNAEEFPFFRQVKDKFQTVFSERRHNEKFKEMAQQLNEMEEQLKLQQEKINQLKEQREKYFGDGSK